MGVCGDGVFEVLVEPVGVLCPQGSEFCGEDSVFWLSVNCCGELGLKMDVGLGAEAEVEGE